RAHERADRVGVGDARELDDDAVGALGRDDRLGHACRVDAALDDLADDLEGLRPGRLVADRLRLVLDPETALEVQPELRLERALAIRRRRIRDPKPRYEADDERGDTDDRDEDGTGFTHWSRMIQGRSARRRCPCRILIG